MTKLKIKNIFSLLASFLLTILIASPVSAEMSNTTLDELYANGVYYYNPEGTTSSCVTGSVNLAGATYEEWVWSGLISLGFTETQAAGIMGNMDHESNYLNPVQHEAQFQSRGWDTAYNDTSISYGVGLIQWSWGRRVEFLHSINDNYPNLIQYFKDIETYSKGYTISGQKFVELVGENIANKSTPQNLTFSKTNPKIAKNPVTRNFATKVQLLKKPQNHTASTLNVEVTPIQDALNQPKNTIINSAGKPSVLLMVA